VVAAAAIGWLAPMLGIVPSPWAATVVRFRRGRVMVTRGRLRPQVREDLTEVLGGFGVERGFIAISANGQVSFSRTIPPATRQRLRNVLLN